MQPHHTVSGQVSFLCQSQNAAQPVPHRHACYLGWKHKIAGFPFYMLLQAGRSTHMQNFFNNWS